MGSKRRTAFVSIDAQESTETLEYIKILQKSKYRNLMIFLQKNVIFWDQVMYFIIGSCLSGIFFYLEFSRSLPDPLLISTSNLLSLSFINIFVCVFVGVLVAFLFRFVPWRYHLGRFIVLYRCKNLFESEGLARFYVDEVLSTNIKDKTQIQKIIGGGAMDRIIYPTMYAIIGALFIFLMFMTYGMVF